jgi:hypothetical protein
MYDNHPRNAQAQNLCIYLRTTGVFKELRLFQPINIGPKAAAKVVIFFNEL